MARVDAATGLKPAYSFGHLVIGPNNHVAAAACREVLKAPGEMYNPLVIYGPAGVGKTHLMHAVAHEMILKDPAAKVKYISAERFMNEVVTAIAEDRSMEVRTLYSSLDLLIMDDVQYLVESKIAQEELFHIFNNMHQENRQVILACDRMPNQLGNLSKGIRSRLEWGLATDVQAPDEPTRLEILKRKQSNQGLEMGDEMLSLVAKGLSSNVRELEGFLKRIHAYVTLSHQPLSLDLVKAVIMELAPSGADARSNGATLHNESPGLSLAPGIAPDLTRVLNAENGHKNGNGKATNGTNGHAKNGVHKKHDAPAESMTPAPAPTPESTKASLAEVENILKPSSKKAAAPEIEAVVPPKPVEAVAPPALVAAAPAPAPVEKKTEVVPAPPAPVKPPMQVIPETPSEHEETGEEESDLPAGHKEMTAVFFFPEGKTDALETVDKKFQDVIKKHKLKFRLKRVHDEAYGFKGKIDYARFAAICKDHKVPVAIVVGPPPESLIPEQDFYDPLTVALDVQGVSLQLVSWGEISKDYRYLNLALDIALVKAK